MDDPKPDPFAGELEDNEDGLPDHPVEENPLPDEGDKGSA